ncbi:MAG: hypothetical protein P1U87_21655 [Verrucomicrobiales bacterium]|nr:hypothetical protein [Verrucomicrobiales bacterium]
MSTSDPTKNLFKRARDYAPFGDASDFGFETRLRAALSDASPTVADWVARFSWRFSVACLPLAIGFAVFLATQQHGQLPEGIGGFVAHWSSYLPVEI